MSKFKISSVGIDTRTMKSSPGVSRADDGYSYILTSVEANNDYMIRDFVENHIGEPVIMTSVNFLENVETALKDHIKNLGKEKINVLLFGPNTNIEKYVSELDGIKDVADRFGLIDPESVDQAKEKIESLNKLGLEVEFVAMPISPLDFNYDLIKFCEENELKIVGLNQMGGYVSAARNIEAFSVPYLLGFSAYHSDIVILSGRDVFSAIEDKWYLSELLDKEAGNGYVLEKNVYKPVKDLKKAIYTSISLEGEGSIVPYDDPTMLFMGEGFRFKIGSSLKKVKEYGLSGIEEDEREITEFLKDLFYPKDAEHSVKMAFARYKIDNYLKSKYPDCTVTILNAGNSVLVISLDKESEVTGAFFWQKISEEIHRQFYLIFPPDTESKDIIFKEFKLSEEDEEKLIEKN